MRARRSENYFTNYRTQYQGLNENHSDGQEAPDLTNLNNNLVTWQSWESKIALARDMAESANDNYWEKSQKLEEAKQHIKEKFKKSAKKYSISITAQ